MPSDRTPEDKAFYDHKRAIHDGSYDPRCDTCRELWVALVAASKGRAGVRDYR
jgi:hypothetical protein